MTAHYKKLGNYIQPINIRNKDLEDLPLMGLSINKIFIPSIANTIGTNMRNYKIIKRNQFAYGPVTSRNGDKITIALFENYDKALISQAYIPFEVVNENVLNPEYLMMWFRRPEFDRYARFKSHGSARETFDWEEMCEVELPMPSIEDQNAIVKEYNTVVKRIKLNEQLNQKLEETAQALYKHWFVDFEFPITKESCPELVSGSPELEGKPYKSSGGAMVYNEDLDKEIPVGWESILLSELIDFKNGKSKPNQIGEIPIYGGNGILGYTDRFNSENIIAIGRVGAYCGSVFYVPNKCWISDNAISGKSKIDNYLYLFYLLRSLNLNEKSEGTGQPLLTQGILNSIITENTNSELIELFNEKIQIIFNRMSRLSSQIKSLERLKGLILSKMTKVEIEKEIAS